MQWLVGCAPQVFPTFLTDFSDLSLSFLFKSVYCQLPTKQMMILCRRVASYGQAAVRRKRVVQQGVAFTTLQHGDWSVPALRRPAGAVAGAATLCEGESPDGWWNEPFIPRHIVHRFCQFSVYVPYWEIPKKKFLFPPRAPQNKHLRNTQEVFINLIGWKLPIHDFKSMVKSNIKFHVVTHID